MFTNASTANTANAGSVHRECGCEAVVAPRDDERHRARERDEGGEHAGDDPEPVWGKEEGRRGKRGNDRKLDSFTPE